MPIYSVTRKTDGAEVHRYMTGEPTETPFGAGGPAYPFAEFDHTEYVEGAQPESPAGPVRITKFAFRSRFTASEKAGLELAALHNAALAIDHPSNLLAAALRANMADQRDAEFIDLQYPATRAGVQQLEAAALLAAGRAAVILDTPATAEEIWNG